MDTWIALLRGINVLGRNKVPMRDLEDLLLDAGFRGVRTYLQSGNVVFQSARGTARTLPARIETLVLERFGFAPRVIVITAGELAAALRGNPFPDGARNHKCLHLYFLSQNPAVLDLGGLCRIDAGRDRFLLKGKVFYLYTPDGFAQSVLRPKVERCLGGAATARNWRTANELLKLADPQAPAADRA